MEVHQAFSGAGSELGLLIWRIEKLEPVPVPEETHGRFYSGDSYIILHTSEDPKTHIRQFHLHFWIGNESSIDEQGSCAIFVVELDDYLSGIAVEHREVQGHESKKFLSYFPAGVQILEGGVDSAFSQMNPNDYKPKLLRVKGKRNVVVTQVELARSAMNEGDVFILDIGLKLFQWNGKSSNKYEKYRAANMINKIRVEERQGHPEMIFLEQGRGDELETEFWEFLGGYGEIPSAESGGLDEAVEEMKLKLFQVCDESGETVTDLIAEGTLTRDMLDPNDVFIVDTGQEVFVWVGKFATKNERKQSMEIAKNFLVEQKRPAWNPITRIVQNGETPVFKALFFNWDPPMVLRVQEPKKIAVKEDDISALYSENKREAEKVLDDGNGTLKIWRIENFASVPYPEEKYGEFYSGDSFIILYSYTQNGRPHEIIYFWQGKDSTRDEKGASALLTVSLDDELQTKGLNPVQVRVVQNKEPNHFLSIFKGVFIVHMGGVPSGFKNVMEEEVRPEDGDRLYHIKSTSDLNARAVEVFCQASNLNSGDVFLLIGENVFQWNGTGASLEEREYASVVAKKLSRGKKITVLEEGDESEVFWEMLGGKDEYAQSKTLQQSNREPRLFHCSNATGSFVINEIFAFTQQDLLLDDTYILDTFDEVWVWVGVDSNEKEKNSAFKAALHYVENVKDGRSPDTPVLRVECGSEPPLFTAHFIGWSDFAFKQDPYMKKLTSLKARKSVRIISNDTWTSDYLNPETNKFRYDDLKMKRIADVDMKCLERYLRPDEFKKVFNCTIEEFYKYPLWKQQTTKKKLKLF